MKYYHITANAADFGIHAAESNQDARNIAARLIGYESEHEMEAQLEQKSALVAVTATPEEFATQ